MAHALTTTANISILMAVCLLRPPYCDLVKALALALLFSNILVKGEILRLASLSQVSLREILI